MRKVTDVKKRVWEIQITVGTIKRIRDEFDINIYKIADGKLFAILSDDLETLVNIFFLICEDQAKEADVSDIEFGKGFTGDIIAEFTNVFLEELVDFFPPLKRPALKKILAKKAEVESRTGEKLIKKVDEIDSEKVVDTAMENMKLT